MKLKEYKIFILFAVFNSCNLNSNVEREYYSNGKVKFENYYDSQHVIKKKIIYSTKEIKVAEINYKEGNKTFSLLYDENSNLLSKFIFFSNNNCVEIKYHKKGIIIGKGKLDNELNQIGKWSYFNEKDSLLYNIQFDKIDTIITD